MSFPCQFRCQVLGEYLKVEDDLYKSELLSSHQKHQNESPLNSHRPLCSPSFNHTRKPCCNWIRLLGIRYLRTNLNHLPHIESHQRSSSNHGWTLWKVQWWTRLYRKKVCGHLSISHIVCWEFCVVDTLRRLSSAGSRTPETPLNTPTPSISLSFNYTATTRALIPVERVSTTSTHSLSIAGSPTIADPDSLSDKSIVVEDSMSHLTDSSSSTAFASPYDLTNSSLDTHTNHTNTVSNRDLLTQQQQQLYPMPHGYLYNNTYQTLPNVILADDNLSMDDTSTWSTHVNLLYPNTYPSSIDPSYASATHTSPSYPNTDQTQLNSYLYTTSNATLPFSEWAIKKNNWEIEILERL